MEVDNPQFYEAGQAQDKGQPTYLLAAAAVSPQQSFEQMMEEAVGYQGNRLSCIEPDYTRYVDAKLIRRMSRVIKMGVAAASEALQQAGSPVPQAIITGTAYGCLADTDQFLTRMIDFKETLLSPTAFIQSTHNTVAAQIALMLQCHCYNNTYVHRGSSFEAALTDAVSLMEEGDASTVLLGVADEITEKSHAILQRFGLYKKEGDSHSLIQSHTKGTMAGEAAAFFVMSDQPAGAIAQLTAFRHFYKPKGEAAEWVQNFLQDSGYAPEDMDLLLTGYNGDIREKEHYKNLEQQLFRNNRIATYKQYCGEYPTSIGFAWWMAAHILQAKQFKGQPVKRILIYNNYMLNYPALYILSAC